MCNSLVLKGLYIRVFYMYKTNIFNALDGVDNFFPKIFGNLKYFSYIGYVNVINDMGFYSLFYYTYIYRNLYLFIQTKPN